MPFKLYRETTATNNSDITFNSYQNSRFNYTITYPSFLTKAKSLKMETGVNFIWMIILIWLFRDV